VSDAAVFVEENGDALDCARLRALLRGGSPPPEVVAELEAAQRSDGGFPSTWAPRTSSLEATCFRLAELDDLPHDAVRPIVERALGFSPPGRVRTARGRRTRPETRRNVST
jgi:hypothetical protein